MLPYNAYQAPFANMRMEHQRWLEMFLIMARSGTQFFPTVKNVKLVLRANLVESYCKEPHISDTNWLRYLFSS